MINQVFQLIAPRKIQVSFHDLSLNREKIIVRPTFLSICAADQRYYMGLRAKEYWEKKLPMALIHEATGEVVYDMQGEYKPGEKVVLIPNTPIKEDEYISENYLYSSKFRASSFDGFMQEYVEMDRDRVVRCNGIDPIVSSVCELISVAMHSIDTFLEHSHRRRDVIGVWGDGNLAYLTALLLLHKCTTSKIVVIGVDPYKLGFFSFSDRVILFDEMPDDFVIDHAFECVGGQGSKSAINQMIKYINPEGTIMLMGVTEHSVPISTRIILEKGLSIVGRSRSGRRDFLNTIDMLKQNPRYEQQVRKILNRVVPVTNINEISETFERDIKTPFKTIMQWNV